MAVTDNLELDIITNNGVFDIDKVDANMEIIDETVGANPSTMKTISKKIIGAINELFDKITTLGTNKLDKGDVSEEFDSAEKIENKVKGLDNETVLFSGSSISTGIITLPENWTNFKEILFIGSKTDDTNIIHSKVYVKYIIPSDATATNSANEYTVYIAGNIFKSVCFRDTNRNELYVTESVSCQLTKIIGIGANQEM